MRVRSLPSDFVKHPGEQGEGVVAEAVVDEVLEVLTPEVPVADQTSFGEGVVVVFETVDVEPLSATPMRRGAPVGGVREAGDGLDRSGLDDLGFLLLFDVPPQSGLVFEVEGLAVGAEQVTDGTGLLVGDDGLFLYLRRVDRCHRLLQLFAVEVGENDLFVAVVP